MAWSLCDCWIPTTQRPCNKFTQATAWRALYFLGGGGVIFCMTSKTMIALDWWENRMENYLPCLKRPAALGHLQPRSLRGSRPFSQEISGRVQTGGAAVNLCVSPSSLSPFVCPPPLALLLSHSSHSLHLLPLLPLTAGSPPIQPLWTSVVSFTTTQPQLKPWLLHLLNPEECRINIQVTWALGLKLPSTVFFFVCFFPYITESVKPRFV